MSSKGRRNAAFNNSKIIRSITNSEPLGKNTSEIALDTGINRTTVTRRCKQLVKDRYLTDKEHKHGKYHITEKVYGDPKLRASIFAGESIRGIFHGFLNYLPIKNEDSASKDSLLLENKFWTSLEEIVSSKPSEEKKALLNFAMKVGVQILYAMIEAIRKHSPKLALGINEIGQASVELRKGIEKDRLAEIWVKNALNPLVIFREFVKLPVIKRGLAIPRQIPQYKNKELVKEIHKSRSNPFVPDNPTLFELDEENFKQIIGAFADLWPITYKGFEDIKNRLPRSVDSTFETRDELEKMDSEKNITEKLKNVLAKKPRRPVSQSFKMLFDSTDKPRSKNHSRKRNPSNQR